MAVETSEGAMQLYLHTVTRLLQDMRLKQQNWDPSNGGEEPGFR